MYDLELHTTILLLGIRCNSAPRGDDPYEFGPFDAYFQRRSGNSLATDLCLSWPKVLNLVTVRASLKTPVKKSLVLMDNKDFRPLPS